MEKCYDELPADQAEALLKRLSTDDAFRDLFSKDPRAALAQIGHAPAADSKVGTGIWESLKVTQLADKETIAKSLAELQQDVTQARAVAHPVALDLTSKN